MRSVWVGNMTRSASVGNRQTDQPKQVMSALDATAAHASAR